MARLTFLGAVGTVTGSKYLLEAAGQRLLIDCGLFQGYKQLRLRNWRPLPFDPAELDAVVLTHAHIDHSGYLPLLVKNGFAGPVFASEGTRDLCDILLPDSGYLQEKDAEFANRHRFSKHQPAMPLYTEEDAQAALKVFKTLRFNEADEILPGITLTLRVAGHILGAAILEIETEGKKLVCSGDLGRLTDPIMFAPARIREADMLLVESTYGNRLHEDGDPEKALAEIITQTAARGGSVLIPAFAVGRSQTLLYHLWQLRQRNEIPELPIYLDSPMAIDVSELFRRHADFHRLSHDEAKAVCATATYVREVEESKELDHTKVPIILISASGMATGGRVLHHLKYFAPDPRNSLLFTGFQASGTRGASLLAGAKAIKIHGSYHPVRAQVASLDMLSAHADQREILSWLGGFDRAPGKVCITHGEPEASDGLRIAIGEKLGWEAEVPEYKDSVTLP
jgi:metallo-beta-lactamase family protein